MKDDNSPEVIAQKFWIEFYKKFKERVENVLLDEKEEIKYIHAKRSLPEDATVGGSEDLMIDYEYLVKPYVEWGKVRTCLRDVGITKTVIERLVFILKPYPLDGALSNPLIQKVEKAANGMCRDLNRQIKELSPLIKRLENLTRQDAAYRKLKPLRETIEALKFDVELLKAIIERKKSTDKKWKEMRLIDKNTDKVSPQKHKFWNITIPSAIKILNGFCENEKRTCIKTAELLKILYPNIWKEDIHTIASRIKQKYYRNLS